MIAIPVRPDLHRRLKIRAIETDHTLEETCRRALEQFLNAAQSAFPPAPL
jgi:plasmid stability protein